MTRNITLGEMTLIVRCLEAGETPVDVACTFGRDEEAMMDAVNAFKLGVSRLAREAKANGTWEATRGAS